MDDEARAATPAAADRARRPRLSDVLEDRRNNFDLIRLVAASMVIYGHSYFEAQADGGMDIVQRALNEGEYAGSVAVYVFFLISGMLVTASMEKHRSALAFVTLRFARIWPGFAVCTTLLLFVVVPTASGVPVGEPGWMRAASACWRHDLVFFVRDVCGGVAGAFPGTPLPDTFGFSWWTLPAEVHCYAMVLALGLGLRSRLSGTPGERLCFAAGTLALLAAFLVMTRHPPDGTAPFRAEFIVEGGYSSYPVLFFFGGMLLYAYRRSIPVDGPIALAAVAAALALPQPNPLVYPALAYGTLALAAARPLRLRPRHDLSYGLYIYGAAVQQVVATLIPGRAALVNFSVSLPLTALVAYGSWRLVEAPAIGLARSAVRRLAMRKPGPAAPR